MFFIHSHGVPGGSGADLEVVKPQGDRQSDEYHYDLQDERNVEGVRRESCHATNIVNILD